MEVQKVHNVTNVTIDNNIIKLHIFVSPLCRLLRSILQRGAKKIIFFLYFPESQTNMKRKKKEGVGLLADYIIVIIS